MARLLFLSSFGLIFLLISNPICCQTWKEFDTSVQASLRGLSVVSENVVWASGSDGTWLKTLDGGKTWDHGVISGMDSVDFRSIHAFDSKHAVVASAGQPAVIFRTSDGGKNWDHIKTLSKEAFLDGTSFSDSLNGFVFGDPLKGYWMILKTTDAGRSWSYMENTPKVVEGEAGFAASGSSMVSSGNLLWIGSGGAESNLWFSEDVGQAWEKFQSPLAQGKPSKGIFSTCFAGSDLVVSVGGDYLNPEEADSTLGIFSISKKKWLDTESQLSGYRSGVTYLAQKNLLVAVGPSGSDISMDLGKNWTSFDDKGYHAVMTDRSREVVWASGNQGRIAKLIQH